ncbi:Rieske (2Fe-2S) protein [Bryobacter aggregatus]|uniref:Rieske (2Fe-2S) protein n=1 Tax=Bryobacter aggregatus TaxID=360054 RepID=UPI0004E22672|nr:Rieske (2Fe-2S) protein [Bryobacter aggregatus]
MAVVAVAQVDDIPEGTSTEAVIGIETYVICNHQGQIHVLEGICPHRNGPLGAGNFADGRVICPYHGWEFDCVSGEYDRNPLVRLKTFPVRIEGGQVLIEIEALA